MLLCVCGGSGEESAVVGEGGEGSAPEGEPAGGPQAEAGGAAAEGRETPSPAGGKAEAKIGEEQGQNLQTARLNLDLKSQSQKSAGFECMNEGIEWSILLKASATSCWS